MRDKAIERIRGFNRYYTNVIGMLDSHFLRSQFSLSEARVLFELNHMENPTARQIMSKLSIDEGYLSRILNKFVKLGLIRKTQSPLDKRNLLLSVTPKGVSQFQKIDKASVEAIEIIIKNIPEKDVHHLVNMMDGIEKILSKHYERSKTR
jgi:DNA-binding MarR family transcriptional regulator